MLGKLVCASRKTEQFARARWSSTSEQPPVAHTRPDLWHRALEHHTYSSPADPRSHPARRSSSPVPGIATPCVKATRQ
ncbi:hypothetical protein PR202_ga31299 [Eleusine coracana subsp. coracana]|uniref:Uncharacterized protein n=1 Tax=Eleusine coracana subsp. coracana TaxID=191504 RepID=A0AAV5DST0_ELECO|nr:hypothetical protein PR202_ga31299 [Eleusine coracana subsp. coracana]